MNKNKRTTKQKAQVWGNRLSAPPDELNIRFCAGRDVTSIPMADEVLLEYDVWTNLAHAKMLCKADILSDQEYKQIKDALLSLENDYKNGEFHLDPDKEDVHINIEHYVTFDKKVEAGKKLHTGRSRNDQVATDVRLYLRNCVLELSDNIEGLIRSILKRAEQETETIMPGFTHYQPAMPTTIAHWMTCWSQGLLRDLKSLYHDFKTLNLSPLGAAASFGTTWSIDREYSAELLGFNGVENNSLDCISSRGENETRIAASIAIFMNHLSTISQDIILLSTPYYNMLAVDDRFVTGSSIMPQKRNPDFAEVIRSKAALSQGILTSLLGIQKGLMSGYNRDSQQTKYLFNDLFRECVDAPIILNGVIESIAFKRAEMKKRCEVGFINSADTADWLAQTFSLSFRDCYEILSLAVKYSEEVGKLTLQAMNKAIDEVGLRISISQDEVNFLNSPELLLNKKSHIGAPSKKSVLETINSQNSALEKIKDQLISEKEGILSAKKMCFFQ